MKVVSPLDGKTYYFIDKALPFGASINCSHFQCFSNCIAHIMQCRTGRKTINYLDNYLFTALIKAICDGQVQTFIDLCAEINFPVNLDKTFWGTTLLVFLGLLIDTVKQLASIRADKVQRAYICTHQFNPRQKEQENHGGSVTKTMWFLEFLGTLCNPRKGIHEKIILTWHGFKATPSH